MEDFPQAVQKKDMSLEGDDAMWQEADFYMDNVNNHTLMWSRDFYRKVVPFLYEKALQVRTTPRPAPAVRTNPTIKELACPDKSSPKST